MNLQAGIGLLNAQPVGTFFIVGLDPEDPLDVGLVYRKGPDGWIFSGRAGAVERIEYIADFLVHPTLFPWSLS